MLLLEVIHHILAKVWASKVLNYSALVICFAVFLPLKNEPLGRPLYFHTTPHHDISTSSLTRLETPRIPPKIKFHKAITHLGHQKYMSFSHNNNLRTAVVSMGRVESVPQFPNLTVFCSGARAVFSFLHRKYETFDRYLECEELSPELRGH